jgi:hypothetical protein
LPEAEHWLSNFGFAVIFHDFPPAEMRPFVINSLDGFMLRSLNTISLVKKR